MPTPLAMLVLDRWVDPEHVFFQLAAASEAAVWLDSSRAEAGLSRFSFQAFADSRSGAVIRYRSGPRMLHIRRNGVDALRRESIFTYLANEAVRAAPADLPFDFQGGYLGYFGYDLKAECGGQSPYASALPDAALVDAENFLAFDHQDQVIHLVSTNGDGAWLARMSQVIAAIAPCVIPAERSGAEFRLERPRAVYERNITQCHRYIREGESYELCLTNQIHAELNTAANPFLLYRCLRATNPAPYAAMLHFGDFSVLSSSPERFLRVSADGHVETKPIKGTRARLADPALDAAAKEELRTSVKDRAENLMITDLLRNDLGRVCRTGSIHVPKLMDVESYATVHQLVSTIRGRLRPELTALDCLRAAFPGGSMTGAPKLRTMSLLDELEQAPRGPYSGAIGYLSANGAADFSIAIRTIVASGNRLSMGVGGAVIALSEANAEFEETLLKARAQITAIVTALDHQALPETVESILDALRHHGRATLSHA